MVGWICSHAGLDITDMVTIVSVTISGGKLNITFLTKHFLMFQKCRKRTKNGNTYNIWSIEKTIKL